MTENICNYDVPEKCIKDILAVIKPADDDKNKRLYAIQELKNSIPPVGPLRGAVFKPFGSFVSNLYSNSGDLDISVQLPDGSTTAITKKKKQNILRNLMRALQNRGVAGSMQFIPHARVPVLQYVSNSSGISCDISVDNYPGRIKSKIFYWISTLDSRFGDMVLLIKEWAKAQNINDPKTGTLNSYSLCLLVLFHFQTCRPAILPPLKEIYEGNIGEDIAETMMYNEEHIDEVCSANLAKFLHSKEQTNKSSLSYLLATFFQKFSSIGTLSGDVISTYTGQFKKIQDNPSWMVKSYSLFVEDPIERPDNAARAVCTKGLDRIANAFSSANNKFASLERASRSSLLSMLCTPDVGAQLGTSDTPNSYTNTSRRGHQHARGGGRVSARPSDNQNHNGNRGLTDVRSVVHNPPRVSNTVRQTNGLYHNHNRQHVTTAGSQTAGTHQTVRPYQSSNHPWEYNRDIQAAGYQNYSHPQAYTTAFQTMDPYQSFYSQSQLPQTPGQYPNHIQRSPARNYNHQLLHATASETEVSYRNQQRRQHAPGTNRNAAAVRTRYVPVGTFQNGPAWHPRSRAQDSSSRGGWQTEQPTSHTYQNR